MRKTTAAFALIALATWACSPDDYPTGSRFDPPPEEIELPDGELFFYVPPAGVSVSSVSLRGSFNEWGETPMIDLGDGRWVAGVELEAGEYMYKYFFNGSDWASSMCNDPVYGDPENEGKVDADVDGCTGGGDGIRQVGTPEPAGHTFLYIVRPDKDVEVVTVAGTFQPGDGWNNQSDTLFNIYEITIDLEGDSTYQYKYHFNGTSWAQNMCDEGDWGNPDYGNAVDPDNDVCVEGGQDAEITIEDSGPHTFRYIVPAAADSISEIHLVGSFQGWNPDDDAYLFTETYQRTYELEPRDGGVPHEYKFIFDGNWAGNMCTDTGNYGDPTTGIVDANGDGTCNGENATLLVD